MYPWARFQEWHPSIVLLPGSTLGPNDLWIGCGTASINTDQYKTVIKQDRE